MADDLDVVRAEIGRLARRKDMRIVPRSPRMPCRWYPTTVTNPETGLPFDDISAWHRIAELAEAGHAIEVIALEQPQGQMGYVMIQDLGSDTPALYTKVQLQRGRIYGRSFHYSTR